MFLIWNSIRGGSIGIIAPGYISRMCVSLWPFADMELVATGYRGHQNSLVYFCPASPTQHVVFFQGDGQVCRAVQYATYLCKSIMYGLLSVVSVW